MDKELIFYIIFGLIYLLSRLGRKKKRKIPQNQPKQQQPQPQTQSPSQSRPQRQPQPEAATSRPKEEDNEETPMSFEDILKELAGEGRKKKETPRAQKPKVESPARKPLVSEQKPPQPPPVEPTYQQVVESDRDAEASELWRGYREEQKKISEEIDATVSEAQDKFKSGGFEAYEKTEKENPLAGEIREMLEDDQDVKKAIVLSEILQRRY